MVSVLGAVAIFVAILIGLSGNFEKDDLFEILGVMAIYIVGPAICAALALIALLIVVLNKVKDQFLCGLTALAIAISALLGVAGIYALFHPPLERMRSIGPRLTTK